MYLSFSFNDKTSVSVSDVTDGAVIGAVVPDAMKAIVELRKQHPELTHFTMWADEKEDTKEDKEPDEKSA